MTDTNIHVPHPTDELFGHLNAPGDIVELLKSIEVPPADSALDYARRLLARLGAPGGSWESERLVRARVALLEFLETKGGGGLSVSDPISTPAAPSLPAIVQNAVTGDYRLAFTFCGQGVNYLDELAALHAAGGSAAVVIETMLGRLQTQVGKLQPKEACLFGHGLDFREWLRSATAMPERDYLESAAVSAPLIFCAQAARLEALREVGFDAVASADVDCVFAGHSQGILAAAYAAEVWVGGQGRVAAERAADYAELFLFQGIRFQQAIQTTAVPPEVRQGSMDDGSGAPSPMASVGGLTEQELVLAIQAAGAIVTVALLNAPGRIVVAGAPLQLEILRAFLRRATDQAKRKRAKGKAAGRLPKPTWEYLRLSAPYHSAAMQPAAEQFKQDLEALSFGLGEFTCSVLDTVDGRPLPNDLDRASLLARLVSRVFLDRVAWTDVSRGLLDGTRGCVIDLGPSNTIASSTARCLKGLGQPLLAVADEVDMAAILNPKQLPQAQGPRYADFAPRLVTVHGKPAIDNRYTRLVGAPPVFLPGMTPTTVEAPIVVAAANAGFMAELAGGGQVTEDILRRRLDQVVATLEPGRGIIFNALYLDAYLWGLHFRKQRLVFKLKEEGYPIVGVTVSAGIPEQREAVRLFEELFEYGITVNALKPGNDAQLKEALAIADACPSLPLQFHIEGGKAGGHHSWESLDDVLLGHYDALRNRDNVIVAVGGGIGREEQAASYLNGRWSEPYGVPAMPVDAVFLGTRLMATREAMTSPAVKRALVEVPGSESWPLDGEVQGGVASGRSQLDASIYYIDNGASRAGRLLDEVAGDEEKVVARRDEIIEALSHTAKPYFGDVAAMTYLEVLGRFVELMAVGRDGEFEHGCWLDISHAERFSALVHRAQRRFQAGSDGRVPLLQERAHLLAEPKAALAQLLSSYPQAGQARLHPQDAAHFMEICRRPGKPVTFVPAIDKNVRRWYKSDSLWQSHDDRFSADAVLSIPGPAAISGIHQEDEGVADVLGSFVQALLDDCKAEQVPVRGLRTALDVACKFEQNSGVIELVPTAMQLEMPQMWFARLRQAGTGHLAAAFGEADACLLTDGTRVSNPIRRLLTPFSGMKVVAVVDEQGVLASLQVMDAGNTLCARAELAKDESSDISLNAGVIARDRRASDITEPVELGLALFWREEGGNATLVWDRRTYMTGQMAFFSRLVFGGEVNGAELFQAATDTGTVTRDQISAFLGATGDDSMGLGGDGAPLLAPLNLLFPLAWRAIFGALVSADVDVIRLVHEDNSVECSASWPLAEGDAYSVEASVASREVLDGGCRIRTTATLCSSSGDRLGTVNSSFFVRGIVRNRIASSEARKSFTATVRVPDDGGVAFLHALPWLKFEKSSVLNEGRVLTLHCDQWSAVECDGQPSEYLATGHLTLGGEVVARIDLNSKTCPVGAKAHPVTELAAMLAAEEPAADIAGTPLIGRKMLRAPLDMLSYALASGDTNPLHLDPAVARFAGFDQPIVHGMWTASAALHRAIRVCAEADGRRVRSYKAQFMAPVERGDQLSVTSRHKSVAAGGPVVTIAVEALRGDERVTVLSATAEMAAPKTAYLFPGQGIQQKGMGMEGYARSKAARAVWDEADGVTQERFGFSLLGVVRDNPKELYVDGKRFAHPAGILFLTQFTQVAMAVMAIAQCRELQEGKLLVPGASFAGHSLGEYSALAALSGCVELAPVVEVVYHRGLTMDRLVERDAAGRSPYAMAVLRPHHAGMSEQEAMALVTAIADELGKPLETVNFNVRGRQYAVTGEVTALSTLERRVEEIQNFRRGRDKVKAAFVMVPGIDVPFHSTLLRDGVPAFRETLQRVFEATIPYENLVDRYVPNLTGSVFQLTREFAEEVLQVSKSPKVKALLASWDDEIKEPSRLARELVVELLAYQFASPVRWIKTQDVLFDSTTGVKVAIEIGAKTAPTLANMAKATLAAELRVDPPRVLNSELAMGQLAAPRREIEIDEEPRAVRSGDHGEAAARAEPPEAPSEVISAAAPAESASPVATQARAANSPDSVEVPVVADSFYTLLALQAKRTRAQIDSSESLDELLGGNSARRNQMLADIGSEFDAGAEDGAHEVPLTALARALAESAGSSYTQAGSYLLAAQEQSVARGLGAARVVRLDLLRHFEEKGTVNPAHVLAVMNRVALYAREGESSRGGALSPLPAKGISDRASAMRWADEVLAAYGEELGVSFEPEVAGGAEMMLDAAALTELEQRIVGPDGVLGQTSLALAQGLGFDHASGRLVDAPRVDRAKERLALYDSEHGDNYLSAIEPRFDARKHVAYTSCWASVKRDVLRFSHQLRRNEEVDEAAVSGLAARMDGAAVATARALSQQAARDGEEQVAIELTALIARVGEGARYRPSFTPSVPVLNLEEKNGRIRLIARGEERSPLDFISAVTGGSHAVAATEHQTDTGVAEFLDGVRAACLEGASFEGKTALVTGAGPGSIASHLVRALLAGGARVVVTTSSYSPRRLEFFKRLYQESAGPGAELHVVPFNQGSNSDVDDLMDWILRPVVERVGSDDRVLKEAWLPDLVVPFGAMGETADLTGLDDRSLAVLRVLVVGVERLIGRLAQGYRERCVRHTRFQVLLPFSPNHGSFGGDGMYGESKAALEALLDKWSSERDAWGQYCSLVGCYIGWVRGTALMHGNDAIAATLEASGELRTFAPQEMALLLAGLLSEGCRARAERRPILADLTGGLGGSEGLARTLSEARESVTKSVRAHKSEGKFREQYRKLLSLDSLEVEQGSGEPSGLARPEVLLALPTEAELAALPELDHLDLDRIVTVVGYGEVGPWGSARTRWALESESELSLETVTELAWMMGLIRPNEGGTGYVDGESGEPIEDTETLIRYEESIRLHGGIRTLEKQVTGFDADNLVSSVEVHLDRDFAFPVPNRQLAEELRAADPEHTEVREEDGGTFTVIRKQGAMLRMAKSLKSTRNVAGQIPTGWDPVRYGIPADLVEQVDRVTLFCLISTTEAFLAAGLNPEELYEYMHPGRVGITLGTGIGGMSKLRRLYRDFADGAERQSDVLQETLINVISGHVVQRYLGSYGPMSMPVAACATAAVSVSDALDKILMGSADLVVAGGADDYTEEGSLGFGDMGATASSDEMMARGIDAPRMSRPNDSRRRGFVESQGAGALILCRGSLALRMGLPVYAVVPYAGTFADGIQRSVPAPGQGALFAVSETNLEVGEADENGADICGFEQRRARVKALEQQRDLLEQTLGDEEATRMVAAGRRYHGHEFHIGNDAISPLRGALAVLGMGADDIGFISKHDTSTQANDFNESRLHQRLQRELGRSRDLPLAVISQKSLTGHPKGAAAAWQINGVMQAMASGIIPPNRSTDNVDEKLREFSDLVFTDAPVPVSLSQLRVALVTSLGFGHVSALLAIGHPFLFWRMLNGTQRSAYRAKLEPRMQNAAQRLQSVVAGAEPLFEAREARPFVGKEGTAEQREHEASMLVDPRARLQEKRFRVAPKGAASAVGNHRGVPDDRLRK